MLKKMLLGTMLAVSSLSAQLNLDLDLVISNGDIEHHAKGIIIINENETTSVAFDGFDSLIVDFVVQTIGDNVILQAQFLQQFQDEYSQLFPMTEWLGVQVQLNQPATITVNEPDNTGSLILTITPSLVE
jgi:hypothetical protein